MSETCAHCGERIEESHTIYGPKWQHRNGVEFNGYKHCRLTTAEPASEVIREAFASGGQTKQFGPRPTISR